VLVTEEGLERAIVLDSVTMVADPFSVGTSHNFSTDQRRRITLFVLNLELQPGEDFSFVTAQAQDAQSVSYPLVVESIRKVPNFNWLTQITLRLPDQLMNAGNVGITISYHGLNSNRVTVTIANESLMN
jgi:hypothetical protein